MPATQTFEANATDYGPIALTILAVALAVRAWRKLALAGWGVGYGLWYQHAATIAADTPQTVSDVMDAQITAFSERAGEWAVSHPDVFMALVPLVLTVYLARKWAMVEPFLLAWFEAPLKNKVLSVGGLAAAGAVYWWLLSHGYAEQSGAY